MKRKAADLRRTLAIAVLLSALPVVALSLTEFWTFKLKGSEGVAFSSGGYLGVAGIDGCAYVFDFNGNLKQRLCVREGFSDVSSFGNEFAFSNYDGYVYVIDPTKGLVAKYLVGLKENDAVTLLSDGFIACKWDCTYYKVSEVRWRIDLHWIDNGPKIYLKKVYIPEKDLDEVLIASLDTGEVLKRVRFDSPVWSVELCGSELAVVTSEKVYLFELKSPTDLEEKSSVPASSPFRVAFSPDCSYLAVADKSGYLRIYSLNDGLELVAAKRLPGAGQSVAWWNSYLAVTTTNGTLIVYEVHGNFYSITSFVESYWGYFLLPVVIALILSTYSRRRSNLNF